MSILKAYASTTSVYFPLIHPSGVDFESTPVVFATGDAMVSKNGTAFANTTNQPQHRGNGIYSLSLSSSEMSTQNIVLTVIDQTVPKAWVDQSLYIQTFGHASADLSFNLGSPTVTLANGSHGGSTSDLVLRSILVSNSTGPAVAITGITQNAVNVATIAGGDGLSFSCVGSDIIADVNGQITTSGLTDTAQTTIRDRILADSIPFNGASIAAILADTDSLDTTKLTTARAGYIDNINGHTPQTGDSFARLGNPLGASVSQDINSVKTKTDQLNFTDSNKVHSDVKAVGGDTERVAMHLVGSVDSASFSPTSSQFDCDIDTGELPEENGLRWRMLRFVTGAAVINQQAQISAAEVTGGKIRLTTGTFTTAPSSGDTFVIF